MTLHATINALASEFAHAIVRALRDASLDDIISETAAHHTKRTRRSSGFVATSRQASRPSRLPRRTEADLKKIADRIVALVATNKKGINAETIKRTLKLERKELPRPLALALATKKIHKRGKKRATLYLKA